MKAEKECPSCDLGIETEKCTCMDHDSDVCPDLKNHHLHTAEIKSKLTKEATLSKIAEVESPWYVVEDEKGEKHIAKRKKETNKKESNEDKPNVR